MLNLLNRNRPNNGAQGIEIALTPVQECAYSTILEILEKDVVLPTEAMAFLPLIKMKLRENLARTDEQTIMATIEKFINRAENLLIGCYDVSEQKATDKERGLVG